MELTFTLDKYLQKKGSILKTMLNCWLASNHELSGYFCFLTKRYDGKNTTKHWWPRMGSSRVIQKAATCGGQSPA